MSESDENKKDIPEDTATEEVVDQTTGTETPEDENGPVNVGHQDNDLHLNTVKRFMIGSFAVTLAFFVLMLGVHRFYKSAFTKDRGVATEETRQIAQKGDALLQTQPLVDLKEYNEIEEGRLNTTADAGEHAVIPVEAAKQLMLKEQAFPTATPEKAERTPSTSPMVADMDEASTPEPAAPARTATASKAAPAPKAEASEPVSAESRKEDPAMIAAGKAIWEANCIVCHSGKKGAIGPNIHKAYGTMRQLENGESILMDDDYVLNSMNNPTEHIAKGYQPVMMSFKQQLTDQQKQQVTAYLRSMGKPVDKPAPEEEVVEEEAPAPAPQPVRETPAPAPAKEVTPPAPTPAPKAPAPAPQPAPKPETPSGAIFV
ncbi:MAG: c-type cytochrome [Kiritimatiellia bacterium]